MISDMDRPQMFNDILDAAEGDPEALRAAARQMSTHDGELAEDLHLAALLRDVAPARSEVDSARLHIGQLLTREILADPASDEARHIPFRPLRLSEPPNFAGEPVASAETAPDSARPATQAASPTRAPGAWRLSQRRTVASGAAAAALFLALTVGLSIAAADSLPDSPLYGLKRGEETVLLTLPLDENTHARALGMVALRRLTEAQAEARAHHDTQATALLTQYSGDMVQLITLAATIQAHKQDSSAVTAQISQLVQAQSIVMQSAPALGDSAFSAALSSSVTIVQATLAQQHVNVPGMNGQNPGKDHSGQPTPTPSPTQSPTPTPSGTPTPSHGHGHEHSGASANTQ